MCGQTRCQGRFCKPVSFLVSRNAYMRRDSCYDHLGLRWYIFKKIVKAFQIFSFKCFTPQAFDCGQAVGVNDKSHSWCPRGNNVIPISLKGENQTPWCPRGNNVIPISPEGRTKPLVVKGGITLLQSVLREEPNPVAFKGE